MLSVLPVMTPVDARGHRCTGCALGPYCLPLGLQDEELSRLDGIMRVSRLMMSGETLFHATAPVRAIYAVRSGCFKSVDIDCEGNEHIVRFHLPGELIGLDGVYSGSHQWSAVALTPARVCTFSYDQLMQLAGDVRHLQERMLKLFSKEIIDHRGLQGDFASDERSAAFLRGLSLRLAPRGIHSERFQLPMKKSDIANHLRLADATFSRTLASFRSEGVIRLVGRRVTVLDRLRLETIARRIPSPLL